MKKILVAGAGGAPSEGVIRSIIDNPDFIVHGSNADIFDINLTKAHRKITLPHCRAENYKESLLNTVNLNEIDFLHFQNDEELLAFSSFRNEVDSSKYYLPTHETILNCVNKYKSYQIWKNFDIKVPETRVINNEKDLEDAFINLRNNGAGVVWLRSLKVGGGGQGALPTADLSFAKSWINHHNGWGNFTCSELLSENSVTWLSLWHNGELVVAQSRKRHGWSFGNRTLSGVTGITKVGETCADTIVDEIAQKAILAIDEKPHGIFGVDLTYDFEGVPNPTEINIGRFFTTILFFTKAGLNIPEIYLNIALYNKFPQFPELVKKINPLPCNLLWVRGMDTEPKLMSKRELYGREY